MNEEMKGLAYNVPLLKYSLRKRNNISTVKSIHHTTLNANREVSPGNANPGLFCILSGFFNSAPVLSQVIKLP